MKIIINPEKNKWKQLLQRPIFDAAALEEKISAILNDIRSGGDEAVKKYTKQFDNIELQSSRDKRRVSHGTVTQPAPTAKENISAWSRKF